ncbi:MAG TPA: Spy/CpxP family protein refolding chaperone [Pseudolabrys sp.]|nr:Spy/CpxP family protein refolding chaperone [Pseudolabrys sp.]
MNRRTQLLTTTLAVMFAASLPLAADARPKAQPHPAAHAAQRAAPQVHRAAPAFHPHPVAHRAAPHVVHRAAAPVRHAAPAHVERQTRHAHRTPQTHTRQAVHQAQPNNQIKTQTQANTNRNDRGGLRHANKDRAHRHGNAQSGAAATIQAQPNARTNAQTNIQSNARQRQGNRQANRHANRHGRNHVTRQAARQGRFATPFNAALHASAANRHAHRRAAHLAARRAWHRGLRASFVPWYGQVFWPYAYSDIFDYTFWPDGYDDGYWAYVYDDFVDGLFWGQQGAPDQYVYDEPVTTAAPQARAAAVEELCQQPGTGITSWPFANIESKVDLSGEQKQLLGDVRDAAKNASTTFKQSCPAANSFALTPPGRLQAMTGRLQATLQAVETVRPALDKFYNSLSDEQKAKFNQLGPKETADNAQAREALPQESKTCSEAKPGLTALPIDSIANVVKPTDAQENDLDNLQVATNKAVSMLQAACPADTPVTPPGRLAAMETRLKAMIEAANTVRPSLDSFYSSLSNEQKARFNRIGKELAQQDKDNG